MKMIDKSVFISRRIFCELNDDSEIIAVYRHRTSVLLNKAVYIGRVVLNENILRTNEQI